MKSFFFRQRSGTTSDANLSIAQSTKTVNEARGGISPRVTVSPPSFNRAPQNNSGVIAPHAGSAAFPQKNAATAAALRGPPAAKMALPPGVKLVSGPPPPGVKLMVKGRLPPPPPGMKVVKRPPPPPDAKTVFWSNGSGSELGVLPSRGSTGPKIIQSLQTSLPQPPSSATTAKKLVLTPGSPMSLSLGTSPPSSLPVKTPKFLGSLPAPVAVPPSVSSSPNVSVSKQGEWKEEKDTSSGFVAGKEKTSTVVPSASENVAKIEGSFRWNVSTNVGDSGSDSEVQFVVESGASQSLQRDDVSGVQKDNISRPHSFKSTSSCASLDQNLSVEERKKSTVKEVGGQDSLLDSRKHDATLDLIPFSEKKNSTPQRQKIEREDTDFLSSCDCSPELLDCTAKERSVQDLDLTNRTGRSEKPESGVLTSETRLSPSDRNCIIERFLSILSPQQFYGKVTKLHHIRPVKGDPERASGMKEYKTIFVATKGTLPNPFFYPQLRFTESDRSLLSTGETSKHVDTPIVLYEAAPGNMLFAETEREAKHTLETNSTATSCFVLEKSAIMFKDPLKYVLPIAMLTVQWIPYSVPQSEPQCPVHHSELQLFDCCTKELLCALCVSKNRRHVADLVVIPEVFNGDLRRQSLEKLSQRLQQEQRNAAHLVSKHQRILSIAKHKKDAVNQQFDLLLAAIKSKREEILEHCDIAFGFALSGVAKEILSEDEHLHSLKAAIDHLRGDSTSSLYSMQIATVVNALHGLEEAPPFLEYDSLEVPELANDVMPNLEVVMAEVQRLSSLAPRSKRTHRVRSPLRAAHAERLEQETRQEEEEEEEKTRQHTRRKWGRALPTPLTLEHCSLSKEPRSRSCPQRSQSHTNTSLNKSWKSGTSSRRRSRSLANCDNEKGIVLNPALAPRGGHKQGQWVAIPGCRGTCVLDVPIHELLTNSNDMKSTSTRPKCLQWVLRVEDPGEWVGIGVGVGGNIQTWTACRTVDLSHLWVVTSNDTRHTFMLRVTVSSSVKHAKLSIHDARGKRLDDGRIPQWNATRSCFPQITFGGQIGEVFLVDAPHLVVR